MTADELLRQEELEARVRRLEDSGDDREALRRRLDMALDRADTAERELARRNGTVAITQGLAVSVGAFLQDIADWPPCEGLPKTMRDEAARLRSVLAAEVEP